ncbi:MAG: transposase [Pseudomonadota bacterium]
MTTRVKIRDEDILIAVVDGLKGFPDAITAVFPETQVQTCVRHRARTVANGEGTLEEGEGPVVGIEHHLRSPSGSNQWHFQRATVHALHPHPPIQITGRAGLLEITKGGQF